MRRSLFAWYPLLQLAVVVVVSVFRLEVADQRARQHLLHERHDRSGHGRRDHAAAARPLRRRGRALRRAGPAHGAGDDGAAAAPRLHDQPRRQPRRRRRLRPRLVARGRSPAPGSSFRRRGRAPAPEPHGATHRRLARRPVPRGSLVAAVRRHGRRPIWSPDYKITVKTQDGDTSSRSTTSGTSRWPRSSEKEYFYQWPYMVVRRHVQGRADPRRRVGHRRRGRRSSTACAASTPSRSTRPSSGWEPSATRIARTPTRASARSPTTRGTSCGRRTGSTTSSCSR